MRKKWPLFLHVDNSWQLLDSVEQQVTLLDGFLVLPVFAIRSEKKTRKRFSVQHLVIELFVGLTVVWRWYSYLLVSTISFTLSILQWRRPAAMNRDSSLREGGGRKRASATSFPQTLPWTHDKKIKRWHKGIGKRKNLSHQHHKDQLGWFVQKKWSISVLMKLPQTKWKRIFNIIPFMFVGSLNLNT